MKMTGKNIIISILALVAIVGGGLIINESTKEHIDGNVMHLTVASYNEVLDAPVFSLPWINNVLACHLAYRTLFLADTNLITMKPDLAAKPAEIIDNGLSYKVTLKSGQKWSDGTEILIEDVVFSIENVQKPRRANNLYKTTFAKIKSLEVNGNEITINMNERTTMLLPMLAQLVILPKKYLENEDMVNLENAEFWKKPVSSGMYKVDNTIGNSIELVVSDTYTGGEKPKIAKVILHEQREETKSDYYYTNNVSDMINFRAMRGYTEYPIDMLFYRYFVFNIEGIDGNQNPAMQDKRVREAIAMAIDRKTLLHSVYLGGGNITNGAGQINDFGPYEYNPEEAKKLLASTDYDLSRPLRIAYYYGDDTSLNFLKMVKSQLDFIGFNTELIRQSGAVELYQKREYDILLKGLASFQASEWFEEYSSRHAFLPSILGGKGDLDYLIDDVIGENDPVKHTELLKELTRLDQEMLQKFPLFTLGQSVYINEARLTIPKNVKLANYFYIADRDFANWEIKKK